MPILQQPEAYVGQAATLFGPDGGVANDGTRAFLTTFMAKFATWIEEILD